MANLNMSHGFAPQGPKPMTIAVVEDYEVRQTFNLDIDNKWRRFQHGDIVEVLRSEGKALSYRCRATRGKWEPVTPEFKAHLINKDLKKVEPVEMPGPVDEVEVYLATENCTVPPGFKFTESETVEVQIRNGRPRAVRHDGGEPWTVASGDLADDIKNGTLVKVENGKGGWRTCQVIEGFFVGERGFAKGDQVEVQGGLIRTPGSTHVTTFDPPHGLDGYLTEIVEEPPPPPDPVLRGTPIQVALALLPVIQEVFHWVSGHDWAVTAPESESKKVAITGQLDSKWAIEIVIDEDETLAILTEDTFVNTSHPIKDRSRAILNTHEWTDFVGWLSVAASLATHPTKVMGQMFLATKPVQIASNRWDVGQVIHATTDESEVRILELVAEGSLVPFTDGAIAGCEGCWHYNEDCTKPERWKSRKCEEWTLTEPPPKRLREFACLGCVHFDDRFDHKGNSVKDCAKRNDIEAREESCSDRETPQFDNDNDIPF